MKSSEGWTEENLDLLLDLQGISRDLRANWEWPEDENVHELVAREVEKLEDLKLLKVEDLDALEREAAESGVWLEVPAEVALLRRYEAACVRRMKEARERLEQSRAASEPPPVPAPEPAPAPAPPPLQPAPPAIKIDPTFDPTVFGYWSEPSPDVEPVRVERRNGANGKM
jgi:hypothetical protein